MLPAPAAETILTLSPKATFDALCTRPACESDTVIIGIFGSLDYETIEKHKFLTSTNSQVLVFP